MRVTIAIPAYDEVGCLAAAVADARAAVGDRGEVLVVDDGSRDGTSALADALVANHPGVRVVHHAANRGFSGAMETCFREARGEWIFLAPADGQIRMAEVHRFLDAAADADVIVGVRASRHEGLGRKALSRGFHLIARTLYDLPLREFSSAFLFRRALLDAMPFRSRPRAATLLPEILFRSRRRGARLIELEVEQFPRQAGRAKGGQLSVALITFVELLRIWPLVRFDEMRAAKRAKAPTPLT